MFQHVEPYPGDPILSLNEAFQRDPRPGKINLSIGIYFDEAGRIPVLESVFIWGGFFVRSGTPRAVVEQLHRALAHVLQSAEVQNSLKEIGTQPVANSPEEFAAVIRAEHARYGRLIAEAGIRLD